MLVLGLPLMAVLSPSELVAMLAHETAHDVNGDARHGLVVGSALRSLYEWDAVLSPPDRVRSDGSVASSWATRWRSSCSLSGRRCHAPLQRLRY